MRISLNGEPREVHAASLADMLTELGFADAKVATAVNGEFIAASARPRTGLSEGDRVEVVAPQQGG